jgi:uncharacterized protein (TIGR02996 family)
VSEGAQILKEILDRPGDDWPRLVYADWCEDHGQIETARFIRAQIANQGGPSNMYACDYVPGTGAGPGHVAALGWGLLLLPTEAALRRHLHCLFGFEGLTVSLRRGFVWKVRCPLQTWLDVGRHVRACQPVEYVRASDRVPLSIGSGNPINALDDNALDDNCVWTRQHDPVHHWPENIPAAVFDRIAGHKGPAGGDPMVSYHKGQADAFDALSGALLLAVEGGEVPA